MKKFTDMLEQHVQWVALGAGAVFLLYMFWAYLLQQPIVADLGGKAVNPGTIDEQIYDGPAKNLQRAMESPEKVSIEMHSFVQRFIDEMKSDRPKYETLVMGGPWLNSPTQKWDFGAVAAVAPGQPQPPPGAGAIDALPVIPPPQVVDVSYGRSTVIVPPLPPEPGAAQPAADATSEQDKSWVTTQYKVAMAPVAQAFKAARIPPANSSTVFLRVELERQEMLPDGSWGNDKAIPPLAMNQVPVFPADAAPVVQNQYGDWATANQRIILQPPFYQVTKGSPWRLPTQKESDVNPQVPFDPANMSMKPRNDDEKKQRLQYIQEQDKKKQEERKSHRPSTPAPRGSSPGGGGRGGGGGGVYAPRDLQRPVELAQLRPGRPGGRFDSMDAAGGSEDRPDRGPYNPGFPGSAAPQNASEALNRLAATVPNGMFEPAKQADIDIIAHDDSAAPGKTYRYRIRYQLRNPVFGLINLVQKPELALQFALPSQYTDWTDKKMQVTIPPVVNFFIAAGIPLRAEEINFKIYRWQNGETHNTKQKVALGDEVGKPEGDIDYKTGWTLVDVRIEAHGEPYALLMDPGGKLVRRDFRSDEKDPINQRLQSEVAVPASVAGAAGASGAPPPPPVPPGRGGLRGEP